MKYSFKWKCIEKWGRRPNRPNMEHKQLFMPKSTSATRTQLRCRGRLFFPKRKLSGFGWYQRNFHCLVYRGQLNWTITYFIKCLCKYPIISQILSQNWSLLSTHQCSGTVLTMNSLQWNSKSTKLVVANQSNKVTYLLCFNLLPVIIVAIKCNEIFLIYLTAQYYWMEEFRRSAIAEEGFTRNNTKIKLKHFFRQLWFTTYQTLFYRVKHW